MTDSKPGTKSRGERMPTSLQASFNGSRLEIGQTDMNQKMTVAQEVIATLMRHDLPAPAIENILSCVNLAQKPNFRASPSPLELNTTQYFNHPKPPSKSVKPSNEKSTMKGQNPESINKRRRVNKSKIKRKNTDHSD